MVHNNPAALLVRLNRDHLDGMTENHYRGAYGRLFISSETAVEQPNAD